MDKRKIATNKSQFASQRLKDIKNHKNMGKIIDLIPNKNRLKKY